MKRMNPDAMYIGIAGNIGSGKTTLTRLLTEQFGWTAHCEDADGNPYLTDFYSDMQRWSLSLQVYFLTKRFKSTQEILTSGSTVVQDRTIYEDAYIFAENLHDMGYFVDRDYRTYLELFEVLKQYLMPPRLLIYLRASVPTLMKQIARRGRPFEAAISSAYIRRLNNLYEHWIEGCDPERLLTIDIEDFDFANNPDDARKVLDIVGRRLESIN